jgi:hypothetical protein
MEGRPISTLLLHRATQDKNAWACIHVHSGIQTVIRCSNGPKLYYPNHDSFLNQFRYQIGVSNRLLRSSTAREQRTTGMTGTCFITKMSFIEGFVDLDSFGELNVWIVSPNVITVTQSRIMGRACSTNGRYEKSMSNFMRTGRKTGLWALEGWEELYSKSLKQCKFFYC